MGATPEISVIAPSYGDREQLGALLASLARQTLAPERFETLVVDDGNEPPLSLDGLETPAGTQLIRQRHAGPAAARNMALRRARGRVLVFVNADGALADDALARHLAHHEGGGGARAVLGRFDFLPRHRTPLVEVAERAGVLFPYPRLTPGEGQPFWAFWTGNLSATAAAVREAGGFDEGFPRAVWEDVELGYRLARAGVPLVYDDGIGCDHDHALTLAGWERHAEWFGHEWVRFSRKHGGATFPILAGADEPTEAFAWQCMAGLLHEHDAHEARRQALGAALDGLAARVAAEPGRREALLAEDAARVDGLFVAVNTVARMRGIVGAIQGLDPEAMAARAARLARPAVVHTVAQPRDLEAVPRLLDVVGDRADLVVASAIYLSPGQLPDDRRLRAIRVPSARSPREAWGPVLAATEADALIFVEGAPLPTASAVRALARFLGVSPWVGAIGLAEPQGLAHTSGKIVPAAPRYVVATTREVLERDPGGEGSFLDRLPQRALAQVALTLAGG
ncbi:MAG: glycosyltransferase [Deltaproteobacteria bacterium]|nr:glycosyltransferase [Deltaproteobacteria bacterium]